MRILLVEDEPRTFLSREKGRTRAEDGAGLGLAIARCIARAHNGDIELVDSNVSGTKFIIRLPFCKR